MFHETSYKFMKLQAAHRCNFLFTAFSNTEGWTYEHYKQDNQLMHGYKILYGNKYSKIWNLY
jgi:hypothetical protein